MKVIRIHNGAEGRGRRVVRSLTVAAAMLAATVTGALAAPSVGNASGDPIGIAQGGLRDVAGSTIIGAAVATNHLGESDYASTLSTEFNTVTPENAMKWDATEPSQGQFNFSGGDQIVATAQQNGQQVRGHTLVWHSQLPGWVSGLTGDAVRQAMENHIAEVAGHYAGDLVAWDVVNEAFEDNGARRNSVFQQQLGDEYIADAFRAARAADPSAKLYYNDFNIEGINAKSNAVFELAQSLAQEGLIDGVGFQGHFILGQIPGDLQQNIQRFVGLGLEVTITELDIRMQTPADPTKLAQQATDYTAVTNACLAAGCAGIVVWGIPDKYSWVPDVFQGFGAPLLFDDNYGKKPAYDAVAAALGG